MKAVTLCADDYAMCPEVSSAILDLGEKQRLHATSCLVTSRDWNVHAHWLQASKAPMDIGLHLNFTEGPGLSPAFKKGLPGLKKMLLLSHLRALDYNQIKAEITAQYLAFCDVFGRQPDFIDGHQHVHHLPVVRKALLFVIQEQAPAESFWVRSVSPMMGGNGIKSLVISGSGAIPLRKALKSSEITTNSAFAGVYSLEPDQPFPELMRSWLKSLPDRGLIMCHPAQSLSSAAELDHAEARLLEYEYLASDRFEKDCEKAGVTLRTLT
ncbi:MAG: ChbG/HpnK family deacetylase [Endozoicomonas sp.]